MVEKQCLYCQGTFYGLLTRKKFRARKFCSRKCAATFINKSVEKRMKMSFYSGKNSWNYIDGATHLNKNRHKGLQYISWRKSIFERDKYTCQSCGQVGGKLNADHKKPWSQYPELRYEISNGKTLCFECHTKTDTWGAKSRRTIRNQYMKEGIVI